MKLMYSSKCGIITYQGLFFIMKTEEICNISLISFWEKFKPPLFFLQNWIEWMLSWFSVSILLHRFLIDYKNASCTWLLARTWVCKNLDHFHKISSKNNSFTFWRKPILFLTKSVNIFQKLWWLKFENFFKDETKSWLYLQTQKLIATSNISCSCIIFVSSISNSIDVQKTTLTK